MVNFNYMYFILFGYFIEKRRKQILKIFPKNIFHKCENMLKEENMNKIIFQYSSTTLSENRKRGIKFQS